MTTKIFRPQNKSVRFVNYILQANNRQKTTVAHEHIGLIFIDFGPNGKLRHYSPLRYWCGEKLIHVVQLHECFTMTVRAYEQAGHGVLMALVMAHGALHRLAILLYSTMCLYVCL